MNDIRKMVGRIDEIDWVRSRGDLRDLLDPPDPGYEFDFNTFVAEHDYLNRVIRYAILQRPIPNYFASTVTTT